LTNATRLSLEVDILGMAIFSKNKTEKDNKAEEKTVSKRRTVFLPLFPHVTEKASAQEDQNKYVFRVPVGATSGQVIEEFVMRFGIKPIKVNIIAARKKARRRGAFVGYKTGHKKVIITLPKDKKIDIVPK